MRATRSVVDHCTGECLGVRAALRGARFGAMECIREGVRLTKRHYEKGMAVSTKFSHSHGSLFISHAFQLQLNHLAIKARRSWVKRPDGNNCVERIIRALKEQPHWLQHFLCVTGLDQALREIAEHFNHWIIGRTGREDSAANQLLILGEAE
jgi:putative transposase